MANTRTRAPKFSTPKFGRRAFATATGILLVAWAGACTFDNDSCSTCTAELETAGTGGASSSTAAGGAATAAGGAATAAGGAATAAGGAATAAGVTSTANGGATTSGGASSIDSTSGGGGTTAPFDWPERCTTVTGSVAQTMVENGADLVDVREQSEFEAGALPDAINIPLSSMASRLKELDETQIIVVYCLSGGRASQALTLLCDAGYVVYSLGAMANYPN